MSDTTTPDAEPSSVRSSKTTTNEATQALDKLAVKGRAPKTGYSRRQFGTGWVDADHNGCDTRNDVLRRDLKAYTTKAGTRGCVVLSGTLSDPYTGATIKFVRGQGTSSAVPIDHVVALADAWQKGAQPLSPARRQAFANDPLNLLAVGRSVNLAKRDSDAASWLPPAKGYRCAFVARQVAVKTKYQLWVTEAEREVIRRILSTCPSQTLPKSSPIPLGGGPDMVAPKPRSTTKPTPGSRPSAKAPPRPFTRTPRATAQPTPRPIKPTATPRPTPQPKPTPAAKPTHNRLDPRYRTCKLAKSEGYGPYRRGVDPEYDWYRDADHDGIVCE